MRLTFVLTTFFLLPSVALAQYNTRQNIELNCYGGRNQMGLHVCACDQGAISGAAALTLGNVTRLVGPSKMADCLQWADEMNGVAGKAPAVRKTPKEAPKRALGGAAKAPSTSVDAVETPPLARADADKVQVPESAQLEDVPDWATKGRLFNNWGNLPCDSEIHFAEFKLLKPAYVDRIETAIKWASPQERVTGRWAHLSTDKYDMSVTFERGQCSVPSSGADWCAGKAKIGRFLPAGTYALNVGKPILCRTAATQNQGFATAWGSYDIDKLGAVPGDGMFAAPYVPGAKDDGDTSDVVASQTPPTGSRSAGVVFDNWNTGHCNLTTASEITLKQDTQVTQLKSYFNWGMASSHVINGQVKVGAAQKSFPVVFSRGNCHPSMPEWCYAEANVNIPVEAGPLTVSIGERVMCHNSASGNTGYMRVTGYEDAAVSVPDGTTTLEAVAAKMRSGESFKIRFDCAFSEEIGTLSCGDLYDVQYLSATNAWKTCGKNTKMGIGCWSYSNAPEGGTMMSVWGMVLEVDARGQLLRGGKVIGKSTLGGEKLRRKRKTPLKILIYKRPPMLGMPGNRQGSGSR